MSSSVNECICVRVKGWGLLWAQTYGRVSSLGYAPSYPERAGLGLYSNTTVSLSMGVERTDLMSVQLSWLAQESMPLHFQICIKPTLYHALLLKKNCYCFWRLKIIQKTDVLECAFILGLLAQMWTSRDKATVCVAQSPSPLCSSTTPSGEASYEVKGGGSYLLYSQFYLQSSPYLSM